MAGFMPSSPECIAPANPGGGWDFTCRAVTKAMADSGAYDGTIQVTNMAGGGGGVAFANVVTERNEDNDLIVAASPATTLRLAQGQYGDFTEEDVRWLGVMGADFAVLTVATDSSYQSLEDLMEALSADLASVNFGGGSAVGGQDHMKVMLLAQSAELDPLGLSYTPFDGGGEALTALLGGFIDVFPGDASEVIGQVESGDVRVLAALTPERLAAPLDEVPTAAELGYSAEWIVFRGFYAPGGMSAEAYDWWGSVLEETANSEEWAQARAEGGLGEFFLAGEEFETFAREQIINFRQLSKDLGIIE
ncbi:tripartite tricarboxylate transporter substrate binding protein [Chloroflexi bacterium TSY]|nr:tripartite tricarboxylate transporter substrate binding protein [Chloroflexi bacterium TSY]